MPAPTSPPALRVAAALVAVQGLVLVVLAVVEVASVASDRVALAVSTGLFFLAYGALLLAAARGLIQRATWARGPVLVTQVLQLGIAYNLHEHLLIAAPLALYAVAVIVAMVHPTTIAALTDRPAD